MKKENTQKQSAHYMDKNYFLYFSLKEINTIAILFKFLEIFLIILICERKKKHIFKNLPLVLEF